MNAIISFVYQKLKVLVSDDLSTNNQSNDANQTENLISENDDENN